MDRRSFLKFGATGVGVAATGASIAACAPTTPGAPTSVFSLGIAAGLHSDTEVVLWTRVEPLVAPTVTSVGWEVGTSPAMTTIVASGTAAVSPASDSCVKVKVGGLASDTSYWYRFTAGTDVSRVGRARTLPAPGAHVTDLSIAYTSCQAYACGYYTAWRQIATQPFDFVLFLGDYIYEEAKIQLLGKVRDEPTTTCLTLEDYRARYRLYKSDTDLQDAHAAHPFALTWDDHEVANDYDAQFLADFPDRATAAYQAWFEYQPVLPATGTDRRIYRSHQWGDLGEIWLLDTRQYRDAHRGGAPLIGARDITSYETATGRTIMGADQRTWLVDGLDAAQAAGRTWKIIGNQVMIAPIRTVDKDTPAAHAEDPTLPTHAGTYTNSNFDSWDGYTWERDLLLGHIGSAGVQNVAFVTGDYHSFWQAQLTPDFDDPGAPVVANDFAAGAISSAGGAFNENFLTGGAGFIDTSPGFNYLDMFRNGYGTVTCTPTEMVVTYLAHQAAYPNVLPTPAVRFTLTPGNPIPTKQLL